MQSTKPFKTIYHVWSYGYDMDCWTEDYKVALLEFRDREKDGDDCRFYQETYTTQEDYEKDFYDEECIMSTLEA